MPALIVNADDFGLTPGVNRAIGELHAAGAVKSTSLMARASATEEAIEIARRNPSLDAGCHIVLVDGDPVLQASEIPSLTDRRTGSFPTALRTFLARLFTRRIRAAEIEAEVTAQIAFLQDRGVRLTHIDTHKHLHIFPTVLRSVLRAARARGISAIRNPFEPAWALRATQGAPWLRLAQAAAAHSFEPIVRRIIDDEGFVTTDGTIAIAGTGILDAAMLRTLLGQMPAGRWELVTHPGYNDADLARVRTRLRASREVERAALLTLKDIPTIEPISFADLARR